MFEFSFLRHGYKVEAGTDRLPLEQSGLTIEQQEKWKEALTVLDNDIDPEITYENVPLIERMAETIFGELPDKALLLFTSTNYIRTRMTSALLSGEINKLSRNHPEKDIAIASVFEPSDIREGEDSLSNLPSENREAVKLLRDALKEADSEGDPALQDFFNHPTGGKNHPKGKEILFKIINDDLASENSLFRKAAERMKAQVEAFKEKYGDIDRPIYFFGIGHDTTFVALDIAINGRGHYDSPNELVEPLTLRKLTQ